MSLQTRLASLITDIGADIKALTTSTMLNTLGGKEKVAAASGTSGTVTLDLSVANVFTLTPTGNVTTLAVTNIPASGNGVSFRLIVSQGATPRTIATPSGGQFIAAATPTQVASKICVFDYYTWDGGTTILCSAGIVV